MTDFSNTGLTLAPELVYPDPRNPAESIDRRDFLAVIGASAAAAGLAGCSPQPAQHGEIVPYVRPPEHLTAGVPLTFATAMDMSGKAIGLLVTSRDGRPTKVEGNPDHPGSLGSTDVFSQASILGLYDPDRSKQVTRHGAPATWNDAIVALRSALESQRAKEGAGLRILTGATASPTFAGVMEELLASFKRAKWVRYEPCGHETEFEGARRAFGEPVHLVHDFSKADVILSLDADFLSCNPGTVRHQREFADRRRVRKDGNGGTKPDRMNRLYVVESMLTTTGANADHRLALKPSEIESFGRALAVEMKVTGAPGVGNLPDNARSWLGPLTRELHAHQGRSIVLVGDSQPASLHALGHALNHTLGNIGNAVRFLGPVTATSTTGADGLIQLVQDMNAGQVELLLVIDCNAAYTTPVDLPFVEALRKVKLAAHLGLYADETATVCEWHLPEAHYLECWGDVRGHDGTATIQQPLIEPLYGGRSTIELLTLLLTGVERRGREIVRDHWRKAHGNPANFETLWEEVIQKGVVPSTAVEARKVKLSPDWMKDIPSVATDESLEIEFRPDPFLYDGRFANNGWLQELPKPVTKLTWGNAAFMSPTTAATLKISQETERHGGQHGSVETDVVELRYRGRSLQAPAFVVPGHAEGAVTVYLGHGRTRAGQVGTGVGFDAYRLRTLDGAGYGRGLEVVKTGGRAMLACTQSHHSMAGRDPVRHTTAAEFIRKPDFIIPPLNNEADKATVTAVSNSEPPPAADRDRRLIPLSLYPEWSYPARKWGMAIDLSACTGCTVCAVACQAENNIPVVGKEQVARAREMHWIRVDRYSTPTGEFFQPMPCMQCENAPCEYVCPVGATVHSHDGLNDMVYHRCVGTRYCSNNCPYKVRRFNFLAFADFTTESLKPLRNPEVTVRSRGVMEKCTYCIQRIRTVEIESERKGTPIPAGQLQTACQQACPSRAISFGDLNNPADEVNRWKAEPHNYGLFDELNTRPRTSYLAAIRNPNPEMPGELDVPPETLPPLTRPAPVLTGEHTLASVTTKISGLVQDRPSPPLWWLTLGIAGLLLTILMYGIGYLLIVGVGIWGINIPVAWGFAITNFVWWIGIGHAGTLISAFLLLMHQKWRTSVNRFAEAMTLFAVMCAGLFPLVHMGRPWFFYWLFPFPNRQEIWPQFRSPLTWDVFAVSTYFTVSLMFWYLGMLPDLAAMRDRAKTSLGRVYFGLLALGWRNSIAHWWRLEKAYILLGGLATPLVLSVHTVVSFDFAIAIVPGWHSTVFPPYFVAGAIYSGFAMVLILAIPLRSIYGLQDFVTLRHLNNCAKLLLTSGLILSYGYFIELVMAVYGGGKDAAVQRDRYFGSAAVMYWIVLLLNVAIPQALWSSRVRTNTVPLFIVSLGVLIGMWLERWVIVIGSLQRGFLPSGWGLFQATIWDYVFLFGSVGLFFVLFCLFLRFLPMISISELRDLLPKQQGGRAGESLKVTPCP